MKILFLNTLDDPADGGGAEVTLWTLMRGLTAAGHQCVLLATSKGYGLESSERDGVRVWRAGIRNLYWPAKGKRTHAAMRLLWHVIDSYNPLMQGYLRQVLATEAPDVVSIHNLPGWSSAAWGTIRRTGIPSVQVLHDQYALCPKSAMFKNGCNCQSRCLGCRLLRLPHPTLSNGVSAVVGVSRFVLERHLAYGCFERVRVKRVIHNAREPGLLGLDAPAVPHVGVRIGFIGRLDSTKGVEPLLHAFRAYDCPDAELWIAGDGKPDYTAALKAQVSDPRVRFLGRIAPREFFPQVDLIVVPSLWHEPLGMVVAEALAFGIPVIGSRRGGIPEMIRDGVNGLLFEPDRPEELTQALRALSGDEGVRECMRLAARESARSFIDLVGWVDGYVALYHEIISH